MMMTQADLEQLPNVRKIHYNPKWNGGFMEYGLQVNSQSEDQADLWLVVRFDKDPRYGRDYMVYLQTLSSLTALWNIVTIEQFKALHALLTGNDSRLLVAMMGIESRRR
jgi:hypothetical protein